MMADGSKQSDQTKYFIKMVDSINCVISVIKEKPVCSVIEKYFLKNVIDIQDGLLENLFNQLEEGSVVEMQMNRYIKLLKI